MKIKRRSLATKISILLIVLASILQPYIVLTSQYGLSSKCWNCSLLEQTLLSSILFLALPLTIIFFTTKKIKMNSILQGGIIALYFAIVSFVVLTIPLFYDRIASWSTFSDKEVWINAMHMAAPSLGLLSCFIFVMLGIINKKRKQFPSRKNRTMQ